MDSGTLTEWRVRPGDSVRRGDIVALVDTDKSSIDVEVFEDGVVEQIFVDEGTNVPVGTVLASIRSTGTPPAVGADPLVRVFVRASPRARHLASRAGVDLASVPGSGEGGAVLASDVPGTDGPVPERMAASPVGAQPASERRDLIRDAVGKLMAQSKREIPHYYLATTVDLSAALAWMAAKNAERPIAERLLPVTLLLRATALAARDNHALNGHWRDDRYRAASRVHLAVAVAIRGGGVLAPTIADADHLSLSSLDDALKDLVDRARTGRLRSSQLIEPTITVTSLGDLGVDEAFGVIYPPQVAIVGFGRIHDAAVAVDGTLTIRPVVGMTLSADHRASDGQEGAGFLARIDRLLQRPRMLEEVNP